MGEAYECSHSTMASLIRVCFQTCFAGLLFQGHDDRLVRRCVPVAVDELAIEPIAVEHGRRAHSVTDPELAVALLKIEAPGRIAVEVETGQVAAAHQRPDVLSVGDRRGGTRIPLVDPRPPIAMSDRSPPQFPTVGADAQKLQFVAVGRCEEDMVAPDGRRGRRLAGKRQPPQQVLRFAELARQILFVAHAVVMRPSPEGPVVRLGWLVGGNRPAEREPLRQAVRRPIDIGGTFRSV